MRIIPVGLLGTLQTEAMQLAVLVKITRIDGTVLGFTTWDESLVVSGVTYSPIGPVEATAFRNEAGNAVDNMNIVGIIDSTKITDSDLLAGRYDDAQIEVFWVNPNDIAGGVMTMVKGRIGQVGVREQRYEAEVRSILQLMSTPIGDVFSQTCRVKRFGDSQCGLTLVNGVHYFDSTVTSVTDDWTITVSGVVQTTGKFNYGLMKLTSGLNNNIEREIKSHTDLPGARIILQEPFPFTVAPGDTVRLTVGCDRRFDTCKSFSNGVNFAGEPFVPGTDQVLQQGRPG